MYSHTYDILKTVKKMYFKGGGSLRGVKKSLLFSLMFIILLLTACSESTEETIYKHLEEAVSLEKEFEEQQGSIMELEKEEQEIYDEIISLSMEDFDKIKELAKKATDNIDKRTELINIENESLEESEEEIIKIEDSIEKLENNEVRKKAQNMYDVMMERFNAYDELHKLYTDTLKLEKELYVLFQEEETGQKELTDHISELNNDYEQVIEANKLFNKYTSEYNERKKDFYESSNLNIDYDVKDE